MEAARQMPRPLVDALLRENLFRIHVPRYAGGEQLGPVEGYPAYEEAARIDGSTGWNLMIGASCGLLWGSLAESVVRDIWSAPESIAAGALDPRSGTAAAVDGGYRVSGRWSFASGCNQATTILAGCLIVENGAPVMGPGGPEIVVVFLPASAVNIIDTWTTAGLRGTGSNDFTIDNVFVPAGRTFRLSGPPPHPEATSGLSIVSAFTSAVGAVPLGIAQHAFDAFIELATNKTPLGSMGTLRDRGQAQLVVAEAAVLIEAARELYYARLREMCAVGETGQALTTQQRARLRMAAINTAVSGTRAVDLLFTAAGGTAVYARCELERCLRDIHTAAQHVAVSVAQYESVGRVLMGLEPSTPFF
jgi:alkylation response protein AidB-like acyl-CoA dehydrogenase